MSRREVVVLGLNGHIGKAVAQAFVATGWDVVGMARTDKHRLPGVLFVQGDSDSVEDMRRAIGDAGLRLIRDEEEPRVYTYESALALWRALHGVGAVPERRLTSAQLRRVLRQFDARYTSAAGAPVTWMFYRIEAAIVTGRPAIRVRPRARSAARCGRSLRRPCGSPHRAGSPRAWR